MKNIWLFISISIVLLVSTPSNIIWVDYHCNKVFYQKFCVNKEIKTLNCNGKCELRNKSKQNEISSHFTKIPLIEFNIIVPTTIELFNKISLPTEKESIFQFCSLFILSVFRDIPYPPPR